MLFFLPEVWNEIEQNDIGLNLVASLWATRNLCEYLNSQLQIVMLLILRVHLVERPRNLALVQFCRAKFRFLFNLVDIANIVLRVINQMFNLAGAQGLRVPVQLLLIIYRDVQQKHLRDDVIVEGMMVTDVYCLAQVDQVVVEGLLLEVERVGESHP